jgi:hypothetical protein
VRQQAVTSRPTARAPPARYPSIQLSRFDTKLSAGSHLCNPFRQVFLLSVVNPSAGLGSGPKTRCNVFVTIQDLGALIDGSMIHSSSIAYAVRCSCSI